MSDIEAPDPRTRWQRWVDWWYPARRADLEADHAITMQLSLQLSLWDRLRLLVGGAMQVQVKVATTEEVTIDRADHVAWVATTGQLERV